MSKTLVVIRHAKSTWEYGPIADFDRPLKEVGIYNSGLVSIKLKELKLKPDLIISSPAIRALHTALITAREFEYPSGLIKIDPGFYTESDDDILDLIKIVEDSVNTLFVFGHNPAFTFVPNMFLSKSIDNLPTSGAVLLTFNSDKWENISRHNLTNEMIVIPKELKQ